MRLLALGFVIGLVWLSVTSPVSADHYRFKADWQNDPPPGGADSRYTWAYKAWAIEGEPIRYCHNFGPGPYRDAMLMGISDWANQLDFAFGGELMNYCGSLENLHISHTNGGGSPCQDPGPGVHTLGCRVIDSWQWDGTRGGYYIRDSTIYFNTYMESPSPHTHSYHYNGVRAVIAHELGHVYGLDENYQHGTFDCNDGDPSTIMDAALFNSTGSGKWDSGCDGYIVQQWDAQSAEDFHFMPTFSACCTSSSKVWADTMVYDRSPTEKSYRFYDYWWTGSSWHNYSTSYFYGGLAPGDWWGTQQLSRTVQQPWGGPDTSYISCMYLVSGAAGWIHWTCFPSQYLS